MKRIWIATLLVAVSSACHAKAYYAGRIEMIQHSDCIAVVEITSVEPCQVQGPNWIYRQKATGTIERCLKGGVEGEIVIHGMEDFICAQCNYEVGRFVVFLRNVGQLWVGANWHLGIRRIVADEVLWFKTDERPFEMAAMPLDQVVAEIEAVVEDAERKME